MDIAGWYGQLVKPPWAPPAGVFGPVWSVLYVVIIASFTYATVACMKGRMPWRVMIPFVLNACLNLIFTFLQFGLKSNLLAAVDILLVLVTLVWAMAAVFPYIRWVAWAQIPYLLWVAFATVLQLFITVLNYGG